MDDKFIQRYNDNKIYELLEDNFDNYLTIFSKKIKHVKLFGLFFKLLPPYKYGVDTINIVINWSEQKLKTYNKEECPKFFEEINIFLNILIKNGNHCFNNYIDILKKNLKNNYLELLVEILNSNNDFKSTKH